MNEPCITPKEAFEAMQKYGEQIAGEIKKFNEKATPNEAGERRFSLEEALEIYKAGRICGMSGHFPSDNCEQKHFKETFGIDLEK